MDTDILISDAIANQGAVKATSPSEATIVQLRDFAKAGDYEAFARLAISHFKAFPPNRHFMEGKVKSLIRFALGRNTGSRLQQYERENKDFISNAVETLRNPRHFELFMCETKKLIDKMTDPVLTTRESQTIAYHGMRENDVRPGEDG